MDNSFLHSKRLLLVDDEQELLKMISDILKDAGFETVLNQCIGKNIFRIDVFHAGFLLEIIVK